MDKARNLSLQLDNFGKKIIVDAVHLATDESYSCTIEMFYPVEQQDAWCMTGQINKEEWMTHTIQSSFVGLKQEAYYKYNIKQISVNCPQQPSSYIYLSIQQMNYGKMDGLYYFLKTTDSCEVDSEKLSISQSEFFLIFKSTPIPAPTLFFQVDLSEQADTQVRLLECSNGSKHIVTHYRTENSSLQFLTNGCQQDCLLIVKQESSELEVDYVTEANGFLDQAFFQIIMCPFADGIDLYNMSIPSSVSSKR